MTMVKLGMVKNITLERLIEIQIINDFRDWKMAEIVGMDIVTWRRWRKRICFTRSRYKLKELEKIVANYK